MNTKVIIVFVAFFAFTSAEFSLDNFAVPKAGINDQIIKLIELLKTHMPCGIPELGVPILAPFKHEFLEVYVKRNLAEIMLNTFDLNVEGLNDFHVNSVSLSVLTLKFKFDFTFNQIKANAQYVANANLLKYLKVTGNGDADLLLKDLRIVGEAQIGANGTTKDLYLRELKLTVVLGQFKSDITGLLWGKLTGKLANSVIERMVPYVLKHKHDQITDLIRGVVIEMANEKMKGLTIKDILDLVNNPPDLGECKPPAQMMPFDSLDVESAVAEFVRAMRIVDIL